MANNITAIQRRVEYGRFYTDAELTENGVYILGHVPDDYNGAFIARLEVCYAVVSTDATGRMLLTTYNPTELADGDEKIGCKIMAPDAAGVDREVRAKADDEDASDEVITLQWRANSRLPGVAQVHADNMWAVAQRELGDWIL